MTSVDYGMLDEIEWGDAMVHDCGGKTISDDWTMAAGYDARDVYKDINGDGNEEKVDSYDRIATGEADQHRAFMHFQDRPSNMIIDECNQDNEWKSQPYNFTISISHSYTTEELRIVNPDPKNGEGDDSNEELNLLMDIIASSSGNVYTAAGFALVKYFINELAGGASVTGDDTGRTFDIPVNGGYDDLPHETSDDIEVAEGKVIMECDIQGNYYASYQPQYTFRSRRHDPNLCSCSNTLWKYKTTAPAYAGFANFDGVTAE